MINIELDRTEKEGFLKIIEEAFYSKRIYKLLIILTHISSNPRDLQRGTQFKVVHELYTWHPVWESENCGQFMEFVLLDRWSNNDNKSFQYLTNHFTLKIPKSFGDCAVFYYTPADKNYLSSGLELSIIEALLSALNLKLQYLGQNADDFDIGDMLLLKTGSGYINQAVMEQLQGQVWKPVLTFPYLFSDMHWFVPCPKRILEEGKFYKVFDTTLWVLVILIFIVAAAITIIIHKSADTDYVLYKSTSYSLYIMWTIFTSVSLPRMPKTIIFRICFPFMGISLYDIKHDFSKFLH